MANWKYIVKIAPEFYQSQEDEISIKELIPVIVSRFTEALPSHVLEDVEPLLNDLSELVVVAEDNEDVDADDFDYVWSDIYDWADKNSVWIDNF